MKYVLMDTNIYVYCALATEGRHESALLHKLHDLLRKDSVCLVVPETVELEFPRVLERERSKYEAAVAEASKALAAVALSPADENTIRQARKAITEHRDTSVKDGQFMYERLLKHKATIRLPLTPETLTEALRLSIRSSKPSKGRGGHLEAGYVIEPDCLIIAALVLALGAGKLDSSAEILFVNNNINDFAKKSEQDVLLHPDIEQVLNCRTSYFRGLPSLLKALDVTKDVPQADVERYERVAERLSRNQRAHRDQWASDEEALATARRDMRRASIGLMMRIAEVDEGLQELASETIEALAAGDWATAERARAATSPLEEERRDLEALRRKHTERQRALRIREWESAALQEHADVDDES